MYTSLSPPAQSVGRYTGLLEKAWNCRKVMLKAALKWSGKYSFRTILANVRSAPFVIQGRVRFRQS